MTLNARTKRSNQTNKKYPGSCCCEEAVLTTDPVPVIITRHIIEPAVRTDLQH